jgi:hypothetical protein
MYPISLEANGTGGESLQATLIDCDGELARDCLAKSQAGLDHKSEGCRAVLGADAILLLVDPTAGKAQIDKEFQQFGNFIHLIEKYRSHRTDVVGLPIYLVLTKCDAFAKQGDAAGAWMQKIEDGKRQVDKRFQDFLAKYPYRSELPFGKVDLHVWATSVKRPALADKPAKSQEPYGVAELFRRCFESAREFHDRQQLARGRLQLALVGYISLIALMACAAAFFFAVRPSVQITLLEQQIGDALPAEHKEWFNKNPEERLAKLAQIMDSPSFTKLHADTQKKVKDADEEIKEYQRQNDYLLKNVTDPKFAKSEDDLRDIAEKLGDAKIPGKYEELWRETRLVKKKKQFEDDIAGMRASVKEMESWLKVQVKESEDLEVKGNVYRKGNGTVAERGKWIKNVDDLFNRRFKDKGPSETIPNTTITYGAVSRFQNEEIKKLRQQLKESKKLLSTYKELVEKLDLNN